MTVSSSMIKHVPAAGVLEDKTPELFIRNSTSSRYRGLASFDTEKSPCVLLEVADTDQARARGLMWRESLPESCGMLFTELTGGAFWMKNCIIPLDIVFLDDANRISIIYSMEADDWKRRYPYDDEHTAIELPYGFCLRHGIRVGMKCNWRIW